MQKRLNTLPTGEDINKQSFVSLLYLHAQMNSSLPVFRLPPETLEVIFIHGARDHYELNSNAEPILRVPDWVNVSYVCRHWRNVALNCSTLWTYHFIVSLRWTDELLARSKRASLKICIRYNWRMESLLSDLVEKLFVHGERIQELSLYAPDILLPTDLSLYAPRLKILDLSSVGRIHVLSIKHGNISPLRILKLTTCSFPWHSTLNLSGVTTLFLCRIPPLYQQNVVEFLAILSRMQSLTVVHLEDTLTSARDLLSSESFDVFPSITLPYLVRLFVTAPLSTIVALLSRIRIPLNTQVKLQINSEDDSSIDDYAQLPSVLAQRFDPAEDLLSPSLAIRSLGIHFRGHRPLLFASALEGVDCYPDPSMLYAELDDDISLVIRIEIPVESEAPRIMSDISRSIPSTHVEALHVISSPSSSDFWWKILGHFDGLQHLKLSEGFPPVLLSLLAPLDAPMEDLRRDVTSEGDPIRPHLLVPALKELELYCTTLISENRISQKLLFDALSARESFSPLCVQMVECIVEKDEFDMDDAAFACKVLTGRYLYDSYSGKYYLEC